VALTPFALVETPFARMRLFATLLLVFMAGVFTLATVYEHIHPAVGYVRAFAEASMVGGIADWFAVTALFRRPLGLPIPHTAIIPRNKDRIGDSLADFIRANFLTPNVVARRLESVDIAGAAARWLAAPPAVRADGRADGRAGRGLPQLLTRLIEALDHQTIGGMVRSAAAERLRSMHFAPILASVVDAAIAENRHEPVVDAAIGWAAKTLDAQEPTIRDMVTDRTSWLLRLASVDDKLADSIVDALRRLLIEVAQDTGHPLRQKITEALSDFSFDLRHQKKTQAKVEAIKLDLIDNPALGDWLDGLWGSARDALIAAINDPHAALGGKFGEAVRNFGARLEGNAVLRQAINLHARRAAVGLVNDYGDSIVALISDTIRGWDAKTVTDKLESAVGRDLQYIRINGTLIGGLVGLTIHAGTQALG
jgi:uncharacterized membrane-anchored protein YjiN (DUF445 family)